MRMTRLTGVAITMAMIAAPAMAVITGSKHDFRAVGGGYPIAGVTDICSSCHVPHQPLMNVPLWGHALSTHTFQLYNTNAQYSGINTAAYNASPEAFSGSMSRACLSCHDGSVAVVGATFITQASANWMLYDNGAKVGGGTGVPDSGMKGSHPVAVNYNTVRTNQPTEYANIAADPDVHLEANLVQCTTCHNAHNEFARMLVKANTNSALCLTCHTK